MMRCGDVEPRLSAYLDDELDESTRLAVAAHVESCQGCRGLLGDLARVKAAVAALPPEVAPEHDLWPSVAAALNGGKVLPFERSQRPRRIWQWAAPLAAAAMLVVVTAAVTSRLTTRVVARQAASVSTAPEGVRRAGLESAMVTASFAAARRDLSKALEANRASLDPATVKVVEDNVRIIDNAVRRIEAALARDPGNPGLQRLLLTAYRQELDLLRAANASPLPG